MSRAAPQNLQVVWFKRDLRIWDNLALATAARHGPVLPLYVVEPALWRGPDMAGRHWEFIAETLEALRADLRDLGQPLVVRTGEMDALLPKLKTLGMCALWSHEETGNGWTFARDLRVAQWCRGNGVIWHEIRNHGVQRRLKSRNGWAKDWDMFMGQATAAPPSLAPLQVEPGFLPTTRDLGLVQDPCAHRQRGGRRNGLDLLESFLAARGQSYRRAMSSPLEGANACSRLSPHLAWGSLSVREVAQATWAAQRQRKSQGGRTGWNGSLSSFSARLHWHCHFIQKLEDAPSYEFENLHRAYDGLRPSTPDAARLDAWAKGETGLPFVDACMRSLASTGWLNFRMRAMVMAVASYHLWLDWRAPGVQLARYFTDYEPGIHWPQVQMQAGTTGINTPRIYNPVKQGNDQDPGGAFTRRWLPELAQVPDAYLQEPWKWDGAGRLLGKGYPEPIVDHVSSARRAKELIWAVRKGDGFRDQAAAILRKHASRKPVRSRRRLKSDTAQLDLPL